MTVAIDMDCGCTCGVGDEQCSAEALGHQAFTCYTQAKTRINYSCDPGKGF